MMAKFNGKWEVERIVEILREQHSPWSEDMAERLERQVDQYVKSKNNRSRGLSHNS